MVVRTVPRLALLAVLVLALVAGFARSAAAQVTPPAIPTAAPATNSVTVNATLQPTLTLLVLSPIANFGLVAPGGSPYNALNQNTTNNSYYYAVGPVVAVLSNAAWTGTITGTDPGTPATTMTLAAGSLHYTQVPVSASLTPALPTLNPATLAATNLNGFSLPANYLAVDALTPITTGSQTWVSNGAPGLSTYAQVYALRVLNTDRSEGGGVLDSLDNFSAQLTYTATQA